MIELIRGLVLFLCVMTAYILGIKHGKLLVNGIVPEINPIKVVKNSIEAKEEKKQEDLVTEGWNNIFSYTGDPQKKVSR